MPFVIVIVLMAVLVVVVIAILMHMPVRWHIFILHVVHTTYRALPRLIAAAAFAVHGANVGGGVFRPLFVSVRINFHVVAVTVVHMISIIHVLGLVGSGIIGSGICIAAAGDDEKG